MLIFLLLIVPAFAANLRFCSEEDAVLALKKPAFDFSIKLLDNVAFETDGHFVFSPLSTWLQLTALAVGATRETLLEIQQVTKLSTQVCYRRKIKDVINKMIVESNLNVRRTSVLVLDSMLSVKKDFQDEILESEGIKTLSLYFNDPNNSAKEVNNYVRNRDDSVTDDVIDPSDFKYSMMMFVDTSRVNNVWRTPFNLELTKVETFYNFERQVIGNVNMMNVLDRFNVTFVSALNSLVLELPCNKDNRVSMLVFLPNDNRLHTLFYWFEQNRVNLGDIYDSFGKEGVKFVNVKLPRFKISTTVDNIPELVHDLGIRRVFYPDLANLQKISDYKMHASKMIQIADIEVSEFGVSAGVLQHLHSTNSPSVVEFIANKPFAYMLVDRHTDLIFYAGMYSSPEVY